MTRPVSPQSSRKNATIIRKIVRTAASIVMGDPSSFATLIFTAIFPTVWLCVPSSKVKYEEVKTRKKQECYPRCAQISTPKIPAATLNTMPKMIESMSIATNLIGTLSSGAAALKHMGVELANWDSLAVVLVVHRVAMEAVIPLHVMKVVSPGLWAMPRTSHRTVH